MSEEARGEIHQWRTSCLQITTRLLRIMVEVRRCMRSLQFGPFNISEGYNDHDTSALVLLAILVVTRIDHRYDWKRQNFQPISPWSGVQRRIYKISEPLTEYLLSEF